MIAVHRAAALYVLLRRARRMVLCCTGRCGGVRAKEGVKLLRVTAAVVPTCVSIVLPLVHVRRNAAPGRLCLTRIRQGKC